MKKRNITLTIAGLIIIAAGCAIQKETHPPTGYVIIFGSSSAPIKVKQGFKAALQKAEWRRGIVYKPAHSGDPSPDAGSGVSFPTDLVVPVSQGHETNPLGLNVTQRVRFNLGQEQAYGALLSEIEP
jgi:hypothetical protein